MTVRVVDILELVDVDHQDAERRVVPTRTLDFGAELRQKRTAIEQLGQRIGARQGLEAKVVRLRHFHHVSAAHRIHGALYVGFETIGHLTLQRCLLQLGLPLGAFLRFSQRICIDHVLTKHRDRRKKLKINYNHKSN